MRSLSSSLSGKNNNFNLIRILAASAVLVTHSFALVSGTGDAEPLWLSYGMTMGSIAVDLFFVTSGFLVTMSLFKRQNVVEFVGARVLRIYPALLTVMVLTVFVLGPVMTSLPLVSYFSDKKTWLYLSKCGSLIFDVRYDLPGVFAHNPWKDAVNGSLWTLPYEIHLYMLLAVIWIALKITKERRESMLRILVLVLTAALGVAVGFRPEDHFFRLAFMFFAGASLYVLREKIYLSSRAFVALSLLVGISVINRDFFYYAYTYSVPYLLFWIAFVPGGVLRKYNKLGDYSFGVYIYAYPVQQTLIALFPGISIALLILISGLVTLMFAVLSWHFIESYALDKKSAVVVFVDRFLVRIGWRKAPGSPL